MAHSDFSPSSASRWMACPESIRRARSWEVAATDSATASEGTTAHEVAAMALCDPTLRDPEALRASSPEGVTDEMVTGALSYAEYVDQLAPFHVFSVEHTYKSANSEIFGTADFIGVDLEGRLHVVDYKFGAGVKVSPEGNKQLMTYAWLFVESEGLKLSQDAAVSLHIYQPRIGGVTTAEVSYSDIIQHMRNQLALVQLVNHTDTRFEVKPGEYCQFCPVKYVCPEYMGQHIGELPPLTGDDMINPHWVASEYGNIKKMKRAMTELEKSAMALANQDSLPGYELVEKKSARKYGDTLLKTLKDAGRYDLIEEKVKSIKALDAAGLSDLLEADGHIYQDTILKLEKIK